MTGAPLVVLDACVLANFSLCDTLLRLAEPPRLFEPKWSEEIVRETTRTLELKLGWPHYLTAYFEKELRAHFGEAWISGYESLIPRMTNDEKDRHVVAAAVRGEAAIILTPQPSPLQASSPWLNSPAVGCGRLWSIKHKCTKMFLWPWAPADTGSARKSSGSPMPSWPPRPAIRSTSA